MRLNAEVLSILIKIFRDLGVVGKIRVVRGIGKIRVLRFSDVTC